jgi:cellulose synthase/poly-beta-1,6-N-acetylglucosamine synthase-like glycosyltransferase
MMTAAIILVILQVIFFLILSIRGKFYFQNHNNKLPEILPLVSILVPARNEEKHLPALLSSLSKLDYPEEKLQILLVDDQSSDGTSEIMKTWCDRPSRTFFSLQATDSFRFNANGKANALSFLEQKAQGEFLFFTDADCQVNPNWIKEGIASMRPEVGLLMGVTQVKGDDFLSKMQEIDWWFTQGVIKIATDLGLPTTGMGNNMVIRREALERVGGFSHLPFCLTEDLEISRSIRRAGYKLEHQVSAEMLVLTKAEASWKALLQQRKRWMQGVMTLPFIWLVLLFVQAVFFPALVILCWYSPWVAIVSWAMKISIQGYFIRLFSARSSHIPDWCWLWIFDFYYLLSTFHTILYYFWPSKTHWKSRSYP